MTHPSTRIDDVVHQRVRLGILAVLAPASDVDFGYIKETLELTDGNLSRHLQVLEDAGYLTITKGYEAKRPRTRVSITADGRRALEEEVRALQELVTGIGNGARRKR